MNYSDIYTICYNCLDVFKTKEKAKNFYIECFYSSEGAEHARYASILADLNFSNIAKDLYEHGIFSDETIESIQADYKWSKDNDKDKDYDKDDFER